MYIYTYQGGRYQRYDDTSSGTINCLRIPKTTLNRSTVRPTDQERCYAFPIPETDTPVG